MNDVNASHAGLPDGGVIEMDGLSWVAVPHYERLRPFLVSVVSPSDHWLYLSTSGGLTAGRVDPESSLFPYVTDDRLHRGGEGGGWTCAWVGQGQARVRWRPFRDAAGPETRRDLLKTVAGDRVRLIETRDDLGLSFLVEWSFSERWGVVRRARFVSTGAAASRLHVLDGLHGILPAGVTLGAMQTSSCLVDAYRRSERVRDDLAVFTLEARLSDRAEPAESLRATTAFVCGVDAPTVWLSSDALARFDAGARPAERRPWTGEVGCFAVETSFDVAPGGAVEWFVVADVQRTQHEVVGLRQSLAAGAIDPPAIEAELRETTAALDALIASVDGLQYTGNPRHDAHHRSNALFNAMRGGVFACGHEVSVSDLAAFVASRDRACAARHAEWFTSFDDDGVPVETVRGRAQATGDAALTRLVLEYLPIWFGRRHGDPSRPWNMFAIRVKNADGSRRLTYQGNWRDIFQNWEALLVTHPAFIEHVVAKFVNATTLDGYNPYRITREGIDWEEPEPGNPWSNIGYWGDHQIPYFTRLLALARTLRPGVLADWVNAPLFSSADVPYRIVPVAERMAHPRHTIRFDEDQHHAAMARVTERGADGRLVAASSGEVLHVGFGEKLLVPVLSKLSNLVPGGGVWMNTQRPEWNDANNALAGFGLSMVTACQLRRHLGELRLVFDAVSTVTLTQPVASWLNVINDVLAGDDAKLAVRDAAARRRVMEQLGSSFDRYALASREGDTVTLPSATVTGLLGRAEAALDATIAANVREDGLLHSYNLVHFADGAASVHTLDVMLEGQVNWLASGALSHEAAADVVESLFRSVLYRDDIGTFLLYPDRALPSFLDKNRVEDGPGVAFLDALAERGDRRIAWRDADGVLRFAPDLENATVLSNRLDELAQEPGMERGVESARADVLARYEATFHHHAFTGRSGTMYGYEGLGCTYWHMVGKLLLAVQEAHEAARRDGASPAVIGRLAAGYERVRDGLGYRMPASTFGAVPTDAYSHTPGNRGAQQPGMTGLVKEELVARRGELGVTLEDGSLQILPALIDPSEWTTEPGVWALPDGRHVDVPANALGFLLVGVPVVLQRGSANPGVAVHQLDGSVQQTSGPTRLDRAMTARLLARDPAIVRIDVRCAGV